jgi:hypothetical protein
MMLGTGPSFWAKSGVEHEERFPRPNLSGSYGFG